MKNLILSAMLAGTAITAMAQEDVLRPNGRGPGGVGTTNSTSASSDNGPIVLGLDAGLNFNFMSQPYTSTPAIVASPEEVLKSGFGLSPAIGLFIDIPVSRSVGIQGRVAFDMKSASNTKNGQIDAVINTDVGAFVDTMFVEAAQSFTMNTISLAALARIDIVDNLFLTIGPIAQIRIGNATRTDRITQTGPDSTFLAVNYEGVPGNYDEITREVTDARSFLPQLATSNATTAAYNSARFGLEIGAGYRFNLTPSIYLAPGLRYQAMFSVLNEGFTGRDDSQPFQQSSASIVYDKATLNSLVLFVQLGFAL